MSKNFINFDLILNDIPISNFLLNVVKEVLLKGKVQYGSPPCINSCLSALILLKILFIFLTEQANFMRRSIELSLRLQLVFPDVGLGKVVNGCNSVVEQLTNDPKVEGSKPGLLVPGRRK